MAEAAATVKAPVIELAMLPIPIKAASEVIKTAEHEEQIDAEEGAIEHRGMCMRRAAPAQWLCLSIHRALGQVAQLGTPTPQNRHLSLFAQHGRACRQTITAMHKDMAEAVFRV